MSDTSGIGQLFNSVAADYDQQGVPFFGPIAGRLVEALDPLPGERCLDVGCGRGAVSRLLVERVGERGEVLGIDLSSEMVRLAAADNPGARFEVGDAAAPGPADAGWDLIASSLVLFFLPDPVAALAAWRSRLRRRGRLGVTTFGAQDDTIHAVDEVLRPYLPELDPRSAEMMARFRTDEGVEEMFRGAGLVDVKTERSTLPVVFADADQWFAFSMSTGQRRAWVAVPEDQRAAVRARCEELLEAARQPDGSFRVGQDVRVTTGRQRM
jgi:ubiquinone/menaquinone biosynthesis C-methylase UbiE